MDAGTLDTGFLEIGGNRLLNRPFAHRCFELGYKEGREVNCWPDFEVGGKRLTCLVIERNGISLAAFTQNANAAGVVRIAGDAFGQFDIGEGQAGEFCEAHAGLQQRLDNGTIPGIVAASAKEPLVLIL
jgi:hypothetical protein